MIDGPSLLGGIAPVPLLVLAGTAVFVLLFDLGGVPWRMSAWVSLTSLVIAAVLELIVIVSGQGTVIQGLLSTDGFAASFTVGFCAIGAAAILWAVGVSQPRDSSAYALVLLAVCGALIAAHAVHMLPMAIGLAILYIASSALFGAGNALHHVVHQSIGLAVLLLGASLLYGVTGSLRFDVLAEAFSRQVDTPNGPLAVLGSGLVVAGLALPLGLVPFHTWLHEACSGARIGGLLASLCLPGAALAILARLGDIWSADTLAMLAVLGILSHCWGNWHALRSRRLEESLAGMAIARGGTLALALVALSRTGPTTLFLVVAGTTSGIASLWAMVANARRSQARGLFWDDVSGLGHRRPWLASVVTLCLLSAAGMPPLIGSMALLPVYARIAAEGPVWVAGLALAGTLMAWLLAGRWVSVTWMRSPQDRTWLPTSPEIATIALLAGAVVLLGGLFSDAVQSWIATLLTGF